MSVDLSLKMGTPSRRFQWANSSLDPSENIGSASHPLQEISMSQGAVDTTLLKALQKLLEGRTDYLTNVKLQELLISYQHALSLSEGNLGTTHMVPNGKEQCVSNPTTAPTNLTMETCWD